SFADLVVEMARGGRQHELPGLVRGETTQGEVGHSREEAVFARLSYPEHHEHRLRLQSASDDPEPLAGLLVQPPGVVANQHLPTGRPEATSDVSLSTATPTRTRSGAGPASRPSATLSARSW